MKLSTKDLIEISSPGFTDDLLVQWEVTKNCNLNCKYCSIKEKSSEYLDHEKSEDFLLKILTLIEGKKATIRLFGGEPTIHPKYFHFLSMLSDYNVEVFTNLIKPLDFYLKGIDIAPKISYIGTVHTYLSNWHSIVDKAYHLGQTRVPLEIHFLFANHIPQQEYFRIKEMFQNTQVNTVFRCVHNTSTANFENLSTEKSVDFLVTQKDGKVLELSTEEIYLKHNLYNYRFWKCDAGLKNLYIDFNGDVYPCHLDELSNLNCMGNLLDDNIQLRENICMHQRCHCELYLTKKKFLEF